MPEPGLHTDSPVDINHSSYDRLCVEAAGDPIVRVEARTGDVHDGTSQHVTAFRSEHKGEVCSVWWLEKDGLVLGGIL